MERRYYPKSRALRIGKKINWKSKDQRVIKDKLKEQITILIGFEPQAWLL